MFTSFVKPLKKVFGDVPAGKYQIDTKFKTVDTFNVSFSAERENDKDIDAKIIWAQDFNPSFATISANGSVDVNGTMQGVFAVDKMKNVPGLTLGVEGNLMGTPETDKEPLSDSKKEEKKKRDEVGVAVSYENSKVATQLVLNQKRLNPARVFASAATHFTNGLSAGGSVLLNAYPVPDKKNLVKDWSAGIEYKYNDMTFVAVVKDKFEKAQIGYVQEVDNNLTLGIQIDHKIQQQKEQTPKQDETQKKSRDTTFTFGCIYKIDDKSSVRAKINTDGKLSTEYSLKLTNNVKALLSAEVTDVTSKQLSNQVGVSFSFTN